jgi:hypothetical protein
MARGLSCVLTGPGDAGAVGAGAGQVAPYSAALEQTILARAIDRRLPLLVSNPDLLRPDGKSIRWGDPRCTDLEVTALF